MNMEEQEITKMSAAELAKYMDEQKGLGRKRKHTQKQIADILEISVSTLKERTAAFRNKEEQPISTKENESTKESQESTTKNNHFTADEIRVLKNIVEERKRDIQLFQEYRIYKELESVPVDADTVRSAFNMSKETTERLKKFSQVRRIPLQDLVELAVINLLNEYDK